MYTLPGALFLLRRRARQMGGERHTVVGARALVPALRLRAPRQGAGVCGFLPQPDLCAADCKYHTLCPPKLMQANGASSTGYTSRALPLVPPLVQYRSKLLK